MVTIDGNLSKLESIENIVNLLLYAIFFAIFADKHFRYTRCDDAMNVIVIIILTDKDTIYPSIVGLKAADHF